jgi:hypothetical protein
MTSVLYVLELGTLFLVLDVFEVLGHCVEEVGRGWVGCAWEVARKTRDWERRVVIYVAIPSVNRLLKGYVAYKRPERHTFRRKLAYRATTERHSIVRPAYSELYPPLSLSTVIVGPSARRGGGWGTCSVLDLHGERRGSDRQTAKTSLLFPPST